MNLGKKLILVAILLFLCVRLAPSALCKDTEISAQWAPQTIKLDGQRSDWPQESLTLLTDKEVSVGLCNDSQRVYVVVAFRKAQWAHMIRMSGLTIWLDPKGKKDKSFMVRFKGGPTMEQMREAVGKESDDAMKNMPPDMQGKGRDQERQEQNALTCFQKNNIEEKPIPMDGSEGPAAAFGIDKGFFVYEFSVPLKESSVRNYGIGVPAGKPIGLGLIWGEMDKNGMRGERPDGERGGMFGGGGGMPGGGDMPGGGGGGMPGGMGGGGGMPGGGPGGGPGGPMGQGTQQKQEIWIKALLTSPAAATSPKK